MGQAQGTQAADARRGDAVNEPTFKLQPGEESGIPLRTYLAGQAMIGLLAHSFREPESSGSHRQEAANLAIVAVLHAEALIAELNKKR